MNHEISLQNPPLPEAETQEELVITSQEHLAQVLIALVFASAEPLSLRKIREAISDGLEIQVVREAIKTANSRLTAGQFPFEIVEAAGGWRFRTRQEFFPWVKRLFGQETQSRRLSQAMLETLSIVAYKQPVTKAEVEAVRGVASDGPLKSLIDRKLVSLGGRSEGPGNPFFYITTKEFLKYFGIQRLPDDLPRVQELQGLLAANELLPQLPLKNAENQDS